VIIVGNKKDEQPLDINRKALREKYPNICAIIETSCQSGDGIKELRDAPSRTKSPTSKEVYDLLPLSWFEVKEQLEAMTRRLHFLQPLYIGICYENKIPEEDNQDQLIDLAPSPLALVLNFREHRLCSSNHQRP
jgi:internalin A